MALRVIAVAFGVVILVASFASFGTSDMLIWTSWLDATRAQPFGAAYASIHADYPPLALGLLALAGALTAETFVAVKGLIFAGFVAYVVSLLWARARDPGAPAHPAVVLDASIALSSLWLGYLDVLFAPFVVGSLALIARGARTGRYIIAGALLALSSLVKWQPVLLLPLLFAYGLGVARATRRWRPWLGFAAGFVMAEIVVLAILAAGFGVSPGVVREALRAATTHDFVSGNCLNVGWITGAAIAIARGTLTLASVELVQGSFPLVRKASLAALATTYGALFVYLVVKARRVEQLFEACAVGVLCYATFAFGAHENHRFLAIVVGAVGVMCFPQSLRLRRVWMLAASLHVLNLVVFYGIRGTPLMSRSVLGIDVSLPLAFVATAASFVAWMPFARDAARDLRAAIVSREPVPGPFSP